MLALAVNAGPATALVRALTNRSACLLPLVVAEGLLPPFLNQVAVAHSRGVDQGVSTADLLGSLALAFRAGEEGLVHRAAPAASCISRDPVVAVKAAYLLTRELACFGARA
ncbi:hypothetical protein SAMN04488570_2824 [Nocardioides scoriae]|uniref:Uncharacterized protein n=1 Tax=Nocardioides scoriae TaxID=642780 RepID=A0A1H1VGH1_9ACTN|nr:hypothetical protein [Nocardioides scoriae]SDS83842.1 hypothetical protein SAMN04488570_2824 [Nocardioides scoriae]